MTIRGRISNFMKTYYHGRYPSGYAFIGVFSMTSTFVCLRYIQMEMEKEKTSIELPSVPELCRNVETVTLITNHRATSLLLARSNEPESLWNGFENKVDVTDNLRKVASLGVFRHISVPLQDLQEVGVLKISQAGEAERQMRVFVATTAEGPLPHEEDGLEFRWFKVPYDLPIEKMESHVTFWIDHALRAQEFTFRCMLDKAGKVRNHSLRQISGIKKDQHFRKDPNFQYTTAQPVDIESKRKSRWDDGLKLDDLVNPNSKSEVYHSRPGLPPEIKTKRLFGPVYEKI